MKSKDLFTLRNLQRAKTNVCTYVNFESESVYELFKFIKMQAMCFNKWLR